MCLYFSRQKLRDEKLREKERGKKTLDDERTGRLAKPKRVFVPPAIKVCLLHPNVHLFQYENIFIFRNLEKFSKTLNI